MKRIILGSILLFLFLTGTVFGDTDLFKRIDRLHDDGMYEKEYQILEDALAKTGDNHERAEIYWRLSRAKLQLTDQLERDGASVDKLLSEFDEGVSFANKALSLEPDNYNAYYWRSANTGRWGETKGILNSLFKAPSMRDDLEKAITSNPSHGDSYYVLGRLYAAVPGIISFGNMDYAISLARKSIDNQEKRTDRITIHIILPLPRICGTGTGAAKNGLRSRKRRNHSITQREKFWKRTGFTREL